MNQKQRDYALARADAIMKNLVTAAEIEHRVLATVMKPRERRLALELGEFSVVPEDEFAEVAGRYRPDLSDFIKFHGERPASVLPGLDEKVDAIKGRHLKVRDQIMLGTESEALVLLEAFGRGEIAA